MSRSGLGVVTGASCPGTKKQVMSTQEAAQSWDSDVTSACKSQEDRDLSGTWHGAGGQISRPFLEVHLFVPSSIIHPFFINHSLTPKMLIEDLLCPSPGPEALVGNRSVRWKSLPLRSLCSSWGRQMTSQINRCVFGRLDSDE